MKKGNKRRFNFVKFFLVLFVLYIFGYAIYGLTEFPIKHIRILNTTYLSDQDILKEAELDNYPSFLLTTTSNIKKNLKNNPYIKDIRIEKKWFCRLYLYIDEYKVLFYNRAIGQTVLEDNVTVAGNNSSAIPHLINFVPDTIYSEFVNEMAGIDKNILVKISEIEYRPNEVDKERFLLTMNDGNYVYLTLYSFSLANKYDDILPTLEDKKGILYLDSGNYFEIID